MATEAKPDLELTNEIIDGYVTEFLGELPNDRETQDIINGRIVPYLGESEKLELQGYTTTIDAGQSRRVLLQNSDVIYRAVGLPHYSDVTQVLSVGGVPVSECLLRRVYDENNFLMITSDCYILNNLGYEDGFEFVVHPDKVQLDANGHIQIRARFLFASKGLRDMWAANDYVYYRDFEYYTRMSIWSPMPSGGAATKGAGHRLALRPMNVGRVSYENTDPVVPAVSADETQTAVESEKYSILWNFCGTE